MAALEIQRIAGGCGGAGCVVLAVSALASLRLLWADRNKAEWAVLSLAALAWVGMYLWSLQ